MFNEAGRSGNGNMTLYTSYDSGVGRYANKGIDQLWHSPNGLLCQYDKSDPFVATVSYGENYRIVSAKPETKEVLSSSFENGISLDDLNYNIAIDLTNAIPDESGPENARCFCFGYGKSMTSDELLALNNALEQFYIEFNA